MARIDPSAVVWCCLVVQCKTVFCAARMDDFFGKKKEVAPVLDLSKVTINSQEEFRRTFEKVPDFKIKPEKVRPEDIKIKDAPEDQKFKISKKEFRAYEKLGTRGFEEKQFTFMDPIPVEMQSLKLEDLYSVSIDWKMLTSLRPKAKIDEEYFSRLVELGKSELRTIHRDKRELTMNTAVRKTKNRSGVVETRVVSCAECGEEFCDGKLCQINNYDSLARVQVEPERKIIKSTAGNQDGGKMRKIKRRVKRKTRSKSAGNKLNSKPKGKASGAKSDTDI